MPELPDITVYLDCLASRVVGRPLTGVRLASPFLLRTVAPPYQSTIGKTVTGVRRLGKRIVIGLQDDLFLVIHLMIAGRLRWKKAGEKIPGKVGLAAFDFPNGTLLFTEASPKKRASLHVVKGEAALAALDPGGVEVYGGPLKDFRAALARENHTLKRALTDPRLFSGIGNAYSDEILHRARLSPVKLTSRLTEADSKRLHDAIQAVITEWIARLKKEVGDGFPDKVTAFHPEMAVHGRYREPCPDCGAPVQRIVSGERESNYCAKCQTGGKILADRVLSRLLHKDWPKDLEEFAAKLGKR